MKTILAILCLLLGACGAAYEPATTVAAAPEAPSILAPERAAGANSSSVQPRAPTVGAGAPQIEAPRADTPPGQPSGEGSAITPENNEAPAPFPAGTTVLHIGDSMAGALGIALNRELAKVNVHGILRYKTASFIPTWAWGKELPLYMAEHNPDLILISLGTNELAIHDPESRAPLIRRIVRKLGGRPCVWIAPPLWAGETGLLAVIRENIAPCRYMDTNTLMPKMPRVADKIHPTMQARDDWARVVVEWLEREHDPHTPRVWDLKAEPPSSSPQAIRERTEEQASPTANQQGHEQGAQ